MSEPVRAANNFYGMLQDFATDNAKLSKLKSPGDIPWERLKPGALSSLEFQATGMVPKLVEYEKALLGEGPRELATFFRDLKKDENLQKMFYNV